MDTIDLRDLPEKEAKMVLALVEFLRQRREYQKEQARPHPYMENPFAAWPLGVKGTLRREEIYEHL